MEYELGLGCCWSVDWPLNMERRVDGYANASRVRGTGIESNVTYCDY